MYKELEGRARLAMSMSQHLPADRKMDNGRFILATSAAQAFWLANQIEVGCR
jgi:hypothetical protein